MIYSVIVEINEGEYSICGLYYSEDLAIAALKEYEDQGLTGYIQTFEE